MDDQRDAERAEGWLAHRRLAHAIRGYTDSTPTTFAGILAYVEQGDDHTIGRVHLGKLPSEFADDVFVDRSGPGLAFDDQPVAVFTPWLLVTTIAALPHCGTRVAKPRPMTTVLGRLTTIG